MERSVPLVVWIVGLSGLTVVVVFGLLLGAMLVHQRRLADEAARWGRHLLEALDGERNRIAAELHDGMVPQLIATRMAIEQRGATEESETISGVITGLRGLAHQLHPPALRHLDLGSALADLADDLTTPTGPAIDVTIKADGLVLREAQSLALYRIAQEAVINATKYAEARSIAIMLEADDALVTLTVRDDGRGVANPAVLGQGFGTRSMRERASGIGGKVEFRSAVGEGTTVTCRVPR